MKSLSDALDVGILMFFDRLQEGGDACLYNIGSERENFPFWIALWWDEPLHFRMAKEGFGGEQASAGTCAPTCFWPIDELPPTLWQHYRQCNRLAN